jgi:hypothetical protein
MALNTNQRLRFMEERDRMLLACLKKQEIEAKRDHLKNFTEKDWEDILAAAMRHGVVPFLFHKLKPMFPKVHIPDLVREKMQRMYYLSAARNTRIYHELSTVLAALNATGINVILLKGAHLADKVYGNIALRPMADVDLLARQGDLLKIHHGLLGLGYDSEDEELSCKIHLAPYTKQDSLKIDVHFDIARQPVSLRYDLEGMWDRAREYACRDVKTLALCPEDLILHLCSHTTLDHGFDNRLIPYIDLWKITDCYADQLDWNQVWERGVQWGMERSVFLMLALTERLLGLPVPELIHHKMTIDEKVLQALDEAERMVFDTGPGSSETVSPIVARMFGPQGWREKFGYFRQRVFPPKERMSVAFQESGDRKNNLKLLKLYLTRMYILTKKHGRIIWSGLRRDPKALRVLETANRKNSLRDWLTGTGDYDEFR